MTIPDSVFSVCTWLEINILMFVKRNIKDGELQVSLKGIGAEFGITKGKARHIVDKLMTEKYLSRTIFARFSHGCSTDSQQVTSNSRTVSARFPHEKSIEERKAELAESMRPYLSKYGKDMLNAFYSYWTQISPNGKKMLFEKQKAFQVPNRLSTWNARNGNRTNGYDRESQRVEEQRRRVEGYASVAAEFASQSEADGNEVEEQE